MNLIFIYGPPGVGKLTVANKLSKLTGYKILHNQLTVDLVCSLFDFEDKISNKLSSKFRLEMLEEAAKANLHGVIITFCFAKGFDDDYILRMVSLIKKYGGITKFVRLLCEKKELHKRVKKFSRRKHRKITSVKKLEKVMKDYDLEASIPHCKSLTITKTHHSGLSPT